MAAPPETDQTPPTSPPQDPPPPFLTWRKIYLLVIGALALQVVLYALLSKATS